MHGLITNLTACGGFRCLLREATSLPPGGFCMRSNKRAKLHCLVGEGVAQLELLRDGLGDTLIPVNPRGNTGLNSQEGVSTGLDWLTLLWEGTPVLDQYGRNHWEMLIDRHLGIEIDWGSNCVLRRGVVWDRAYRGSGGADYMERQDSSGSTFCRMSLPGQVLGQYTTGEICNFIRAFKVGYPSTRCSRIDLRIDDYAQSLSPLDIIDAIESGYNCGFRSSILVADVGLGGGLDRGWTLSLGSRQSDKYYRYYNKQAESKGEVESWRLEVEFKAELAEAALEHLIKFSDERVLHETIVAYTTGGLDFLCGSDKNLGRRSRCAFWERWLGYLRAVPLKIQRRKNISTISRKIEWIRRQVSGALYLSARVLSSVEFVAWLEDIMLKCTQRNKSSTEALVSEYFARCSII